MDASLSFFFSLLLHLLLPAKVLLRRLKPILLSFLAVFCLEAKHIPHPSHLLCLRYEVLRERGLREGKKVRKGML
jgi:hypothetical protein